MNRSTVGGEDYPTGGQSKEIYKTIYAGVLTVVLALTIPPSQVFKDIFIFYLYF